MELPVNFEQEIQPTYATVVVNKKKRRVRHFGAVTLYAKDGKVKVIWPECYMYIKNEPRTRYTHDIEDTATADIKKKNEKDNRNQHENDDTGRPSREHKSFKAMFRKS